MARGAAISAAMATGHGDRPTGDAATWIDGGVGVAWNDDGTIVYVGAVDGLPWEPTLGSPDRGCIVPGFVDCHTHLPFVGWRADEFEARLRGVSYRELHGGDGGIFRSARMFAEASDDEVLSFSHALLDEMLAHGTTALELKTGYGLSIDQELRAARLARRLADEAVQTCTVTLLAAHAVPVGMKRRGMGPCSVHRADPRSGPRWPRRGVDVYVEDIAFSLDDLEAIAAAAERCWARTASPCRSARRSGAAAAAARLGARSADHLNHCSARGCRRARCRRDGRGPASRLHVLPAGPPGPAAACARPPCRSARE